MQRLRRQVLERVDVDLVLRRGDGRPDGLRPDLHQVGPPRKHLVLAHPDDRRLELVGDAGRRVRGRDAGRRG